VGGADGGGGGGDGVGGGVGGGGGGGGGAPVGGKVEGWKESDEYGKFLGISTFFNPGRHENKVDNFRHFRASVSAQGLQLLCVELTFGRAPPQLAPHDCDILLHRNTAEGNTLWQKERLLNIALQSLPASVEKVMWLDTDLIFLNDNWVPETAALLDEYSVVQPFGWMTYLPASAGTAPATWPSSASCRSAWAWGPSTTAQASASRRLATRPSRRASCSATRASRGPRGAR